MVPGSCLCCVGQLLPVWAVHKAVLQLSHPAASGSLLSHPWLDHPPQTLASVSGECRCKPRWEGEALFLQFINVSSRQREMGPRSLHRAVQGCLVATAGFNMKKQCILLRMEVGTVCSLLHKHWDSHSLGEEINAPKYKVCLISCAYPVPSSPAVPIFPIYAQYSQDKM